MNALAPSLRFVLTRKQQRGVGTLVISLILLICMTLVAFFANKSLLFEQKTSANQMRSTKAFEAAEAGIEWATSMLDTVLYINANCTTTGTNIQSFRAKYLPYVAGSGFAPVSNVQPGCSMSATSGAPVLSCSCPAAGTNPSLNSSTDPTFTVKFEPVNATTLPGGTADTESVLVTSYGCTSADPRCVPGASGSSDAYQKISVILKLRPALRAIPAAAVTTGGSLQLTSAASSISNTDPGSNGTLVDAGNGINTTPVPGCSGSLKDFQVTTTLPGTPWQNAMIANDASLSALSANPDAMFESYFGTTLAQFQADTSTAILGTSPSCPSDTANYDRFLAAYNQGYRAFYTTCGFQSNNDLGSAASPIIFVTTSALKFNGGTNIYGLVYGDQVTWDQVGLGNGSINGALVVRGNYCANANAAYNYSGNALTNTRGLTGSMVRVPGSWKDF